MLVYVQAQFLREYKLVVVGGGGKSYHPLPGYLEHKQISFLKVWGSPPSQSSSFKVISLTNTTRQLKVSRSNDILP